MFQRLATSQYKDVLKTVKNIFCLTQVKIFDRQCFATWPIAQTFCLLSKFQMFDKQCLIVLPGLKGIDLKK